MELLAGVAFLLRKCFEKLGRSGIALFWGGLARRSEPLVPCGRLRGVACVIAHDAAPDAKDERSGAARVIDHDAAPRALDECGRATLPITTRPAAQWLAGCGSGSGILVGFLRKPIFAQTRPDRGRPVSPRGVPPADELSAGGGLPGGAVVRVWCFADHDTAGGAVASCVIDHDGSDDQD